MIFFPTILSFTSADQLFQYIAKETEVKHGSVYGLNEVNANGTVAAAAGAGAGEAPPTASQKKTQ